MKKIILLIMMLVLIIPISIGYSEVQYSTDNITWHHGGFTNGNEIILEEMDDGINHSTIYYFRIRNVYDNGVSEWAYISIETLQTIEEDEMSLSMIIGLGIIAFLFLYFAFHLDKEEHMALQLLLMFFFIFTIMLIPATLIYGESNTMITLNKITVAFFSLFIGYIFIYFNYVLWLKSKLIDLGVFKKKGRKL